MYLRAVHVEESHVALHQFLMEHPLGVLITAIGDQGFPTLHASHIPFVIDELRSHDEAGPLLTLRGHMARANPHAKALKEMASHCTAGSPLPAQVMVLFSGSAQSYVPPRFYVATKPQTQKVVPTWNYSAAQCRGRIVVHHDMEHADSSRFLSKQLEDLTDAQENAAQGEHSKRWHVSDAPDGYISALKRSILGIEIRVEVLEGKHKMSQEMPLKDALGVFEGFASRGDQVGREMAEEVWKRNSRRF